MKSRFVVYFLFFIISTVGCSPDPNEEANALYVNAVKDEEMRASATSYREELKSYKDALVNVELILSNFPTSNVAVRLASGDARLSALTVTDYRKLYEPLEALAAIEEDPLHCALVLVEKIDGQEKWFKKSEVYTKIAGSYAKAGQGMKASELLDQSVSIIRPHLPGVDERTLKPVVEQYVHLEQFSKALEIAKLPTRGVTEALLLAEVARSYARSGDNLRGAKVLSQSLEILPTVTDKSYNYQKAVTLVSIGGIYADIGQDEKAEQVFSQAIDIANSSEDDSFRTGIFLDIAAEYVRLGYREKGLWALSQSNSINTATAYAISQRALLYHQLDQTDKAREILPGALADARKHNEYERAYILVEIADVYREIGDFQAAEQVISQAIDSIQRIPRVHESLKNDLFPLVANEYAKLGEYTRAFEAAGAVTDVLHTAEALANILDSYISSGNESDKEVIIQLSEICEI